MADNRSEKSKFPSRYSPKKWVTAAQYIIELVCETQAKKKGKDLPTQFWKLDEWQKEFVSQTRSVNKLLKKYEAQAIINTIKSRRIWSLRPKWVENVIQQEQKALDGKRAIQKAENLDRPKRKKKPIIKNKRRPSRLSRSKLLAIDEVDYGEEEKE